MPGFALLIFVGNSTEGTENRNIVEISQVLVGGKREIVIGLIVSGRVVSQNGRQN